MMSEDKMIALPDEKLSLILETIEYRKDDHKNLPLHRGSAMLSVAPKLL